MPYIRVVPEQQAGPELRLLYQKVCERFGFILN